MSGYGEIDERTKDFIAACDDMVASKFILADKKIANILKSIVASPVLMALFKEAVSGFDFALELSKCKTPNSFNRTTLRLPASKTKFVALVFILLADFDCKRLSLIKFLDEYYYCEDGVNQSYLDFVRNVIAVFKKHVLYIVEAGEVSGDMRFAEEYFEKTEDDDDAEPEEVPQNDILTMVNILRDLIGTVASDNSLNVAEREEILTITDGLSNAIVTRNNRLIKIMWIGFKNTLKARRIHEDTIPEVATLLNKFFEI